MPLALLLMTLLLLLLAALLLPRRAQAYAFPIHMLVGYLTAKGLERSGNPLAVAVTQRLESFLAAGQIGSDIILMPYSLAPDETHAPGCPFAGEPFRAKVSTCPACGAGLLPFTVTAGGETFDRQRLEKEKRLWYRHSHLQDNADNTPPRLYAWAANTLSDAAALRFGAPGDLPTEAGLLDGVAFTAGWFTHVIADAFGKGWLPDTPIDFFGSQYAGHNLPAMENLALTTFSYDFGFCWPRLGANIVQRADDNKARCHFLLADPQAAYRHWRGLQVVSFADAWPPYRSLMQQLLPINRRCMVELYMTWAYTFSPSPAADPPHHQRASYVSGVFDTQFNEAVPYDMSRADQDHWQKAGHDLFDYALGTGFAAALATMAERAHQVYERALDQVPIEVRGSVRPLRGPDLATWAGIVKQAKPLGGPGRLQVDGDYQAAVRALRRDGYTVVLGESARDYQEELAATIATAWRSARGVRTLREEALAALPAGHVVLVGGPAFNRFVEEQLGYEAPLRLKYLEGFEGQVRFAVESDRHVAVLAGFSDYGDRMLKEWVGSVTR